MFHIKAFISTSSLIHVKIEERHRNGTYSTAKPQISLSLKKFVRFEDLNFCKLFSKPKKVEGSNNTNIMQ